MKNFIKLAAICIGISLKAQTTYYWDGGGANTNWSTLANWAISNGMGGYTDPTSFPNAATAIVIFDGGAVAGGASANKNCAMNGSYTVSTLTINGYTGTITLPTGKIFKVSSTYNQYTGTFTGTGGSFNSSAATFNLYNTGTFTASGSTNLIALNIFGGTFNGGTATIAIGTSINISGGTLNSTSGTLSLSRNFSLNSGTFNHNSGTVKLTVGLATLSIVNTPGTLAFYNLLFDNNFSGTTAVKWTVDNFTVNNDVTITTGNTSSSTRRSLFDTGTITIYGNLTLSGASTYKTEASSGTATFNMAGSTSKNIFSNTVNHKYRRLPNLTISNTAGITQSGSIGVTGNFTVNANAIFNASSDTIGTLGDFTVNGTFNSNSGSINFDDIAASTQTLGGTAVTTYNNIIISRLNTNEVLLGSTQRIKGRFILRNTKSRFNTNGNTFTFLSSATGTASLAKVFLGGAFTGSVQFQRYIPARSGRYFYQMGSPVSGATFAQIKTNATSTPPNPDNGVFITGWYINGHNPDIPSIGLTNTATPSIKALNATTAAVETPSNITSSIVQGKGYEVFIRDGNATSAPSTGAKLLTFTGTLQVGNFNFPLGYSPNTGSASNGPVGGWNFISNPYPSDITADLSNSAWITTSANLVDNTVYQYDPDAKAFITCLNGVGSVGSTGNAASRACVLSSTQGFQVRTTATGTLTATESIKISNDAYGSGEAFLRVARPSNTLAIQIKNKDTQISHGTLLRLLPEATAAYDKNYDAPFLKTEEAYITVASKIGDESYSINSLQENFEGTVALSVNYPEGNNVLNFENNTLEGDYTVTLEDKKLGIVQNISKNPVYQFSENNGSEDANRFVLKFKYNASNERNALENTSLAVYPNPSESGNITLKLSDNKSMDGMVTITDVRGQVVFVQNISGESTINLKKDLTSGFYFIKLESNNTTLTEKLIVK